MANATKERKLLLTDTPNVAQVIRIVAQMQYQDRWHRRLRAWFRNLRQSASAEVEADITSIGTAATARKRFDASGKVILEPGTPEYVNEKLRQSGPPTATEPAVRILHDNEGGKAVAIDGLATRPKITDL